MKVSAYLAISGVLAVLFGLVFLLAPEFSGEQYGIPANPHAAMLARYFGSTLLAYGLIFWSARGTRDDLALRALLLGAVVGNVIGLVVSAWTALTGLQNAMAWSSVAIYGVLLLGAAYFLTSPGRRV